MIQFYRQLFIISMLLTVLTAAGFSVEKVHAEQLESLYDEQVLVLNQSEGERARAGRQAFERVFRRLTGKQLSGFVSAPPGNVDNYLEQFSYAPSDKFIESNSSGFEELLPAIALNFRFSSEAMGEYARRLGVPLWSANRPTTLVWMVVDRQGSREYLNEEGFGLEYGYIRQQDTLLGLPIIFPLHDLQDELVVSVEQVWDLDQDAIHQASLRYQADSILVVKVAETASGKWLGSWHYYLGGKGFDIGVESESLFGFLEAGIENLSGYLAQRFTVSDTLDHRVQLSVSGVRGFSALVD
ncbi:MAG: DUF2066 domain-containing protein, partial [Pseudomonadales bacterium]|nr:DUF2066 domain-containing protein [Pseudomonadales bacterium]